MGEHANSKKKELIYKALMENKPKRRERNELSVA